MKTKIIIFLGATAFVTLSFTFASFSTETKPRSEQTVKKSSEPIGGLFSEDKF